MIIFVRNGEKKGYKEFGLSENGIKQASKRVKEIKTLIHDYCNLHDIQQKDLVIRICSSPFSKCLQTAQIIKDNFQDNYKQQKKQQNVIYLQYELGDYRHPYPTVKDDIDYEVNQYIMNNQNDLSKEQLITSKYLSSPDYLRYQKDTDQSERQRISAIINELSIKQEKNKKCENEITIVVTHKFALEILVDIFEGNQKLCDSGLIALNNNKEDKTMNISFVGEVFKFE